MVLGTPSISEIQAVTDVAQVVEREAGARRFGEIPSVHKSTNIFRRERAKFVCVDRGDGTPKQPDGD